MIVVIDASVAVKWFVEEALRDAARNVLRGGFFLVAPDLISTEVANALRKKVRDALVTQEQAHAAFGGLQRYIDRLITPQETLTEAFDIACALNHPLQDCVYLACAQLVAAQLLTDDETIVRKSGNFKSGIAACRLADWPVAPAAI